MVMFLAFQPLSVNLGALAKEKNETTDTTDCNSCSQQAPLQIEKNGFLNDSVVVNEVKQDLDIAENFTHTVEKTLIGKILSIWITVKIKMDL